MDLIKRPVRVLVLVNKTNFNALDIFIKRLTPHLLLVEVDLYLKNEFEEFKKFINSQRDLYTLMIDFSFDDIEINGCGPRYKNIFQLVDPNLECGNHKYADLIGNWYTSNYDFSVLKIGAKRDDAVKILEGVLMYLNGK